jgi:Ni,Fe-hydrogenase III large subunit
MHEPIYVPHALVLGSVRLPAGRRDSPRWQRLPVRGAGEQRPAAVPPGAVTTFPVAARYLEEVTSDLADLRLADLFAVRDPGDDALVLRLVWANDTPGQAGYVITETRASDGPYPALSSITPAAFAEECEIYEQFGVRPATGGWLSPGAVTGYLDDGAVSGSERPGSLYPPAWREHRLLERQLPGKTPHEALSPAGGLSTVAMSWAFAAAAEAAAGIQLPAAVLRTRAVALELERLRNHAAALAALCQAAGASTARSDAGTCVRRLLRLNAQAFGDRYLSGLIQAGGVSRRPDAAAIRRGLPAAYGDFQRAASTLLRTGSVAARADPAGIVTARQAALLGLVGPVARAAGVTGDARQVPGGPYGTGFTAATAAAGDVLARLDVMLAEAAGSVTLISGFLSAGAAAGAADLPRRAGTGLGWAESPHGEALAWVSIGDDGCITRARLRPASARNWRGTSGTGRTPDMLTGVQVTRTG